MARSLSPRLDASDATSPSSLDRSRLVRLERRDPLHHVEALERALEALEERRETPRGGEVRRVVAGDVEDAEEEIDGVGVVFERVRV